MCVCVCMSVCVYESVCVCVPVSTGVLDPVAGAARLTRAGEASSTLSSSAPQRLFLFLLAAECVCVCSCETGESLLLLA